MVLLSIMISLLLRQPSPETGQWLSIDTCALSTWQETQHGWCRVMSNRAASPHLHQPARCPLSAPQRGSNSDSNARQSDPQQWLQTVSDPASQPSSAFQSSPRRRLDEVAASSLVAATPRSPKVPGPHLSQAPVSRLPQAGARLAVGHHLHSQVSDFEQWMTGSMNEFLVAKCVITRSRLQALVS